MSTEQITAKIIDILVEETANSREDFKPETTINDNTQLGIDSMDFIEVLMAVEEEFGITIKDEESEKLVTISDVVKCVEEKSEPK